MDVFPLLSSNFSLFWCVLHLICLFFSYFVWLSLTGCRAAHNTLVVGCEPWSVSSKVFTTRTSSCSFCLFLLAAAAAAARCSGDGDVYIAHKFLNSSTWHRREKGNFAALCSSLQPRFALINTEQKMAFDWYCRGIFCPTVWCLCFSATFTV